MEFKHYSVMLSEAIEGLDIKPDGVYADLTLGGSGHSKEIAKRLTTGKLIAVDKDTDALNVGRQRLEGYNVEFIHSDFKEVIPTLPKVDGILMDLGVSSYQIDNPERGFSYRNDGELDMRMDLTAPLTAKNVVNEYEEGEIADILFRYGEERYARKIAQNIVKERQQSPITTTSRLAEIIEKSIPPKERFKGGHPARRSFQAIRIEVNGELAGLYESVLSAIDRLNKGGRLCIITFHSLEDRAVKQAMRYAELDCICPPQSPICTCNKVKEVKCITKKPILPSREELAENKRSESAKLRIAEKLI